MPVPLVMYAAYGSVLLVGAALYTIQNAPGGVPQPGQRARTQPAPSTARDFEGAIDHSDPYDPTARLEDNMGSTATAPDNITDLQNAAAAEATQACEYCAPCGFAAGTKANASYPFRPAMDYQERVVRIVGQGQPPFTASFGAPPRIEEWGLPDSSVPGGTRKFDGFQLPACFLIEAKLGYQDYLTGQVARVPIPGADTDLPTYVIAENATALGRMANVVRQMRAHNRLANRYPIRPGMWFKHHVLWFCSNVPMKIYCYTTARTQVMRRIHVYYLPVGTLPPSLWRP